MKQNLRQKEFLVYFKRLTEQSTLFYKDTQFIELKKYVDYLCFFFRNIKIYTWNYS